MDTKQIGNLTELQCITRFYELGYTKDMYIRMIPGSIKVVV